MTMKYLKDVSIMYLAVVVSVERDSDLKRLFSAEREILKLVFAFSHISYARDNAYQHVYLINYMYKLYFCICKRFDPHRFYY